MKQLEEYQYEWWLAGVRPLGDDKKRKLLEYCGSAKEVHRKVFNIEERQMSQIPFLRSKELELLRESSRNQDVARICEEGMRKDIRLIVWSDPEYPKRLKLLNRMPYGLYVKGRLPKEDALTVSIVGARRCTPYGEEMAIAFAEKLALGGAQIISGMARGIDGAAQRAALEAGADSFGILGCGVDVCYPKENRGLYLDLQNRGGILSEQPPGVPPLREYFPARNRLISGLADVILVMEAREKSGSLITAGFALEQGKDIYALPGPVTSALSRGCNELINDGAGVLLTPENLLEQLKLKLLNNHTKSSGEPVKNEKVLETPEKLVYATVGLFPKSLDILQAESGMKRTELIRTLFALEMKGYIKELSRNYFVKI